MKEEKKAFFLFLHGNLLRVQSEKKRKEKKLERANRKEVNNSSE
jgi:hypothetical protein